LITRYEGRRRQRSCMCYRRRGGHGCIPVQSGRVCSPSAAPTAFLWPEAATKIARSGSATSGGVLIWHQRGETLVPLALKILSPAPVLLLTCSPLHSSIPVWLKPSHFERLMNSFRSRLISEPSQQPPSIALELTLPMLLSVTCPSIRHVPTLWRSSEDLDSEALKSDTSTDGHAAAIHSAVCQRAVRLPLALRWGLSTEGELLWLAWRWMQKFG
jgi:hypothetical protein